MLDNAVRDKVPTRLPAEPLKLVLDPAQWTGAALDASDDWKFVLTADDIAELDDAVAGVEARGLQIKDITLANFPLPQLDATLARLRHQLMEGRGIAVLRGVPVSQNKNGHLLGHVYDLLGPSRDGHPSYRAYHTSAELNYHSDSCDVVG